MENSEEIGLKELLENEKYKNAGSLFLTAKRLVYSLADQILNDLEQIEKA